jgi:hypothetical protein
MSRDDGCSRESPRGCGVETWPKRPRGRGYIDDSLTRDARMLRSEAVGRLAGTGDPNAAAKRARRIEDDQARGRRARVRSERPLDTTGLRCGLAETLSRLLLR